MMLERIYEEAQILHRKTNTLCNLLRNKNTEFYKNTVKHMTEQRTEQLEERVSNLQNLMSNFLSMYKDEFYGNTGDELGYISFNSKKNMLVIAKELEEDLNQFTKDFNSHMSKFDRDITELKQEGKKVISKVDDVIKWIYEWYKKNSN